MGNLKFNDGWQVNTSGDLRVVSGPDGLYVVGKGMLIPVDSQIEGEEMIRKMQPQEKSDGTTNR